MISLMFQINAFERSLSVIQESFREPARLDVQSTKVFEICKVLSCVTIVSKRKLGI